MYQLGRLVSDLERFHHDYRKLNPEETVAPISSEELIKSGRLVLDFYGKTFIPKYGGKDGNIFDEARSILFAAYTEAKGALEHADRFTLSTLFIPSGTKKGEPDLLEKLIKRAKKQLNRSQ